MYSAYTNKIDEIIKHLRKKNNFNSITENQKKILLSELKNIEIINTREVFVLWILFFVWFKTYHSCILTFNNNEKIVLDITKNEMNKYFISYI